MTYLSLCSGICAPTAAWRPLGWHCVAFAEIEPFPSAVLAHHYPEVPNLGDLKAITEPQIKALGPMDVVVAGFPCQDVSHAAKRKGLKHADGTHTRSGLFFDCLRIFRWSGARFLLLENVPGLFSTNEGRDFATVVGELAGGKIRVPDDGWRNTGFALGGQGLVEWRVLDAQYDHLAQRRERVFIVLDTGDWANRPPLLLEPASLRRDPPPRRETPERIAPSLAARTRGGGGLGTDAELDGAVIPVDGVAAPLKAEHPSRRNAGSCPIKGELIPEIARALNAERDGYNDGSDQTYVPEVAWALQERDSKGADSSTKDGHLIPVAYRTSGNCGAPTVVTPYAVRRLTVTECERLQGFPDHFTRIPWRGKPAEKCPDGPRYRAIGNSMPVPVLTWIGRRIQQVASLAADCAPTPSSRPADAH